MTSYSEPISMTNTSTSPLNCWENPLLLSEPRPPTLLLSNLRLSSLPPHPKQLFPVPSHRLQRAGQQVTMEDSQCLSGLVFRKLPRKDWALEKAWTRAQGLKLPFAQLECDSV